MSSSPPLIWIVIPTLSKGGAERQAVHLGQMLLDRGAKVVFVTLLQGREEYGMPQAATKLALNMSGAGKLAGSLKLIFEVIRQRPFAVITFTLPGNLTGRLLKMVWPPLRLITSIRTEKVGGMMSRLLTLTKGLDKHTVFNSQLVSRRWAKRGLAIPERSRVVYNLVSMPAPASTARQAIRQKLNLTQGDFLWGTIGRFQPVKNHLLLIESGSETWLKRSHLVIVGDGILRNDIEKLIKEKGLEERVHLAGLQSNISDWCAAMDAFVLPSQWEGMPNGLLEAMFCGLPCVSTEVGGVAEVLQEGLNGIIVPPNQPGPLSDAMLAMMDLPLDERQEMARRGQAYILNNCAPQSIAQGWADVVLGPQPR